MFDVVFGFPGDTMCCLSHRSLGEINLENLNLQWYWIKHTFIIFHPKGCGFCRQQRYEKRLKEPLLCTANSIGIPLFPLVYNVALHKHVQKNITPYNAQFMMNREGFWLLTIACESSHPNSWAPYSCLIVAWENATGSGPVSTADPKPPQAEWTIKQ